MSVALVLVLLGSGCMSAGSGVGHSATIPPPSRWQRISPPGSAFSVAMPGQPEVGTEVEPDFDGTPIHSTVGKLLAADKAVFGYVVIDSPGGFVDDPYAAARDAARGSGQQDEEREVVRREKKYEAHGFLITDRIVDMPDEGVVLYMRMYVGKTRAFGAFLAMARQAESTMRPVIDGYFGSVQLDPAQAVTPVGDGRLTPDRWEFIYPPEADFAIRMPGSARGVEGQQQFAGQDVYVRRYGVQNPAGTEVFEVVVTEFDDDLPKGAIAAARRGWTKAGYTVRSESFVQSRGFGGSSVRYENAREAVQVNYYETSSRLYEVRVRMPRGSEAALRQARKWFIDSFRIY